MYVKWDYNLGFAFSGVRLDIEIVGSEVNLRKSIFGVLGHG
jgi:hypothetical protein